MPLGKSFDPPRLPPAPRWTTACSKVIKVKAENSEGTDLVDHPGAIEVPIFRRLPPAEARGSRAGLQGHFQGDVPAHVAGVAEEELLKETPGEAAVERILEKHGLAPGVWHTFTTAQSHEELHKPDTRRLYCRL